jgi:hypothetical protein
MRSLTAGLVSLVGLLSAVSPAMAQYRMVPEWSNTHAGGRPARVLLLNSAGAIVAADWIPDAGSASTYDLMNPKVALQVNSEVWVVDQVADSIFRFSVSSSSPPIYLSKITGGMDNIRGAAVINGEVWVTNKGTANGAPGQAIVRFDTNGAPLGNIPLGAVDPFDVAAFGNEVLVSDIAGDQIVRYSTSGAFLGVFHAGGGVGIDFPQQILVLGPNQVMVAGFSTRPGLYTYDGAGQQTSFVSTARGINGISTISGETDDLIYSESTIFAGIYRRDTETGNTTIVLDGPQFHYITELNLLPCSCTDYDGDGDVGTDADIEAFFACLGGNCCATCGPADIDGDGDVGTDADIEAFFRYLGGVPCC